MENEQEKQVLYNRLAELTKDTNLNQYFSKPVILNYIRLAVQRETNSEIVKNQRWGRYWNPDSKEEEAIDLDDMLPRHNTTPLLLEELVKEGKVLKTVVDNHTGYRAKIFPRSL